MRIVAVGLAGTKNVFEAVVLVSSCDKCDYSRKHSLPVHCPTTYRQVLVAPLQVQVSAPEPLQSQQGTVLGGAPMACRCVARVHFRNRV